MKQNAFIVISMIIRRLSLIRKEKIPLEYRKC